MTRRGQGRMGQLPACKVPGAGGELAAFLLAAVASGEGAREQMTIRCVRISAAILSLLILETAASAAGKESRERAARKACLTGDTAKGVELLADLFIDFGNITYVFNQGRCFEQNRRYEDAIARFREYLLKGANLSDEEKADAEKHIAACQSYLGQPQATHPAPPAPAPAAAEPAAAPTPVAPVTPQLGPSVSGQPGPPGATGTEVSGLRIAGTATASLGLAAVVAGVALTFKVNSMSADLETPYNYNRGTDSTRAAYKTLVWASYGVGTACLAGGALMYYLGWRKQHNSRVDLALVPTLEHSGAGAILAGGF